MGDDERDLGVDTESVGFTASGDDESNWEEISAADGCADAIRILMRGFNTRPGPDEEVIVQITKRPRQPKTRDIRVERDQR